MPLPRVIKGFEPITVEFPVFMIFGQPGIGKSTLLYSAPDPLSLDFDKGAHRAKNRKDTVQVHDWSEVEALTNDPNFLEPYRTIGTDTVGRCLDTLADKVAADDPKNRRGTGDLSLQGFGALKNGFRRWTSTIRGKKKFLLLIAHDREEKDGDNYIVRPDIQGGSYAEVMKIADFVGYMYLDAKTGKRMLDFNATGRWIGKNPLQWPAEEIPAFLTDACREFIAHKYQLAIEGLGKISEENAKLAEEVDGWRQMIKTGVVNAKAADEALEQINKIADKNVLVQAKHLLAEHIKTIGVRWNTTAKHFEAVPQDQQQQPSAPSAPTHQEQTSKALDEQIAQSPAAQSAAQRLEQGGNFEDSPVKPAAAQANDKPKGRTTKKQTAPAAAPATADDNFSNLLRD